MSEQRQGERRSKGGRKRKPADELRSSFIGFRGTFAERAEVMERASVTGTSMSDFARAALLKGILLPPRTRDAHYPPEVVAQLRRLGNNLNQILREARFGHFPPQVATAAEEALQETSTYLRGLIHGPEH